MRFWNKVSNWRTWWGLVMCIISCIWADFSSAAWNEGVNHFGCRSNLSQIWVSVMLQSPIVSKCKVQTDPNASAGSTFRPPGFVRKPDQDIDSLHGFFTSGKFALVPQTFVKNMFLILARSWGEPNTSKSAAKWGWTFGIASIRVASRRAPPAPCCDSRALVDGFEVEEYCSWGRRNMGLLVSLLAKLGRTWA